MAARYGPIYKLSILGLDMIVLSNWKLVDEACDDSRFRKSIKGELEELRNVVHDGLFTSTGEEEENWGIAHRVLVSAFGPLAIRGMFDEMHEVASQLVLKWARQGPTTRIDVGEDFTRLTLDTVALTSMGFRFNSYYQSEMHPFITAMYDVLTEVGKKGMRFLPSVFYASETKKYHKNIALLRRTARKVIDERKASPDGFKGRRDLLTAMLESVDVKTGRKMTEDSVIDNLITFLVAGHETTSATLQFTMYNLLKHPDKYHKLQEEIDSVVGTAPITLDHVTKLKYLDACIRETLRLSAPIFAFGREPKQDEILGGKYRIRKDEQILCLLSGSHRDPEVWGPDADEFEPERMLDGGFDRIQAQFPHSWSPFGTGMRSCIGRAFAWQEMLLAYAAMLQTFSFVMDNPAYTLQTQTSLTIRPKGFYIRAIPRGGLTPLQIEARLVGGAVGGGANGNASSPPSATEQSAKSAAAAAAAGVNGHKMAIYYGSNSGTCEFMARRLGQDATDRGFTASVEPLDVAKGALPKGGSVPVVIVASSYEGQAPHNAGHFVQWIESMSESGPAELEDVTYAVFGCGHSDWAKTYQRIPRLLDTQLSKLGGQRLVPMGETDAKVRDMFSDFETWQDETLWPAIQVKLNITASQDDEASSQRLKVSFSTPRTSILRPDVKEGLVAAARSLTGAPALSGGQEGEEKRHLEIQLPTGWTYTAGDYLAVLPHNPKATVARVMRRLHMAWDAHVSIEAAGTTTLPTNTSLPVSELLSSYVELGQVATRKDVATLSRLVEDAEIKAKLENMAADGFDEQVRAKQLSVLGLLEAFPALMLPFNIFLSLLPPMRVRQYSISSSPLASPGLASLTYNVIDRPATSGTGRHIGVASSYLASVQEGDKVQVAVRSAAKGFHLPLEPRKTPIICVGAGTGLAPFRAFVQERALLRESSSGSGSNSEEDLDLAPALLFYGCRDPAVDDLYRDEFDAWEAAGVVKVFRACSRVPDSTDGCKYVQDRLWRERELVGDLWSSSEARIYVCGASRIVEGVKDAMVRILQSEGERRGEPSVSYEQSLERFEKHQAERFVRDVFD
ncbi:cytochrome P450 [Microdochium trichocladiopsis]|uniref:Bifunctional cytochrome P450/NADPH--P450 reductase n=1 Tax=Microdochium trichocladiopsis TaxID=1682393 RepID=A0A9P9BLM4_9PEZI|nr:cytochrome P450 [Microdochium trichocladiopsis]KAH7028748.1 cytochrome P450 [Microdochium trichocladiopsis]